MTTRAKINTWYFESLNSLEHGDTEKLYQQLKNVFETNSDLCLYDGITDMSDICMLLLIRKWMMELEKELEK